MVRFVTTDRGVALSRTGDPFSAAKPQKVIPRRRRGRGRRRRQTDARRALVGVSRLAQLLVQPLSYKDTAIATNPAVTWAFTPVTDIAEGDDISGRTGRQITLTEINMRGGFASTELATTPVRLRVILFQDMQNQGEAPGADDVFTGATPGVDALRNFATSGGLTRFRFLFDRYYVFNKQSGSAETNHPIIWNKKMRSKIEYTGNLSTDEGNGMMYYGICVDSIAGGVMNQTMNIRVWFIE